MNKIYITDFNKEQFKLKELSPLVRPFYDSESGCWSSEQRVLAKRDCAGLPVEIVNDLGMADTVLVSEPLDHRHDRVRYRHLAELNFRCSQQGIFVHVFISGDFGKVHPSYSNVIYYRLGGFKSQLNENNKALFSLLSDHLKRLFNRDAIVLREKKEKPTIGFCGHASYSIPKYFYEKAKYVRINAGRAALGDFRFEPLFSSAFERQKLLRQIEVSDDVNTNFVGRKRYRAGASTDAERQKTTFEYYDNIINSDYILCLRGGGNFSVRLYETLMMGRIPVFVNTDCLLPLEDEVDWKRHVVWVEWKDRGQIAAVLADFHKYISEKRFLEIQTANRELWLSKLRLRNYISRLFAPPMCSEGLDLRCDNKDTTIPSSLPLIP